MTDPGLWHVLEGKDEGQVSTALKALAQRRSTLGTITDAQATLLLHHLHPTSQAKQLEERQLEERKTCACLLLLAQWCRQYPSSRSSASILDQVTCQAISVASTKQASSDLRCAACTLLSCSAIVYQPSAEQSKASLTQTLLDQSTALVMSDTFPDLLLSTGRLCANSQDYDTVLWLVVLMLQLWDGVERPLGDRQPAEEIHDSFQSLSQMTALYKAVRLAAVSTAQSHQKQSTSNDKQQRPARLAAILFATQEAQCRGTRAAGIVAAAGALEGYSQVSNSDGTVSLACEACMAILLRACDMYQDATPWVALLQQAAALAFFQANAVCNRPEGSLATLRCGWKAFLACAYSLEGFFEAARTSGSPIAASQWLAERLKSPLFEASSLHTKHLAAQYMLAGSSTQEELRQLLADAIQKLATSYSTYVTQTPLAWMQEVNGGSVRQVLHKIFTSSILLMTCCWESQIGPDTGQPSDLSSEDQRKEHLASWILDQCAKLQFCRVRINAYSVLLKMVYSTAAKGRMACSLLLGQFPCYSELISSKTTAEIETEVRYKADTILAAEMHFRMQLIGPCVVMLSQADILEKLVPLVYLYLDHPLQPVTAAAHSLYCAILQSTSEAEQLAPYYIRRSLDNYPAVTPLRSFTLGVDVLLRILSPGSPLKLFSLKRVCERSLALSTDGQPPKIVLALLHLQAYMLLVLDVELLHDGLDMVKETLAALPKHLRLEATCNVQKVLAGSDDAVRKVWLVRWIQAL